MTMSVAVRHAVFRLEADAAAGGGHLMRCAALAGALSTCGWRSHLAATAATLGSLPDGMPFAPLPLGGRTDAEPGDIAQALPGGVDLLVVDHYGRGAEFETAARRWARRIAVMDDSPLRTHDCEFLIDSAPGRSAGDYAPFVNTWTELLLGPEFAALDSAYAAMRPQALDRRVRIAPVERLLLFLGSGDQDNILSLCFDALETLPQPVAIVDLVLGATAPNLRDVEDRLAAGNGACRLHVGLAPADMARLTADADLAVGAAGVNAWERCCLGLPAVVVIAAENQRDNAAALAAAGAATVLGIADGVTALQLGAAIARLIADGGARRDMARRAAALCDGMGANRIATRIDTACRADDGGNSWRSASA